MFAGMQPADIKSISLSDQLKPIRSQLVAKRKAGFSLKQIADALKVSKLKCDVSPSMLKVILQSPAAKRKAKMKKLAAQRAANIAAAKAASATPTPPAR
jgi:hypothetical protein